MYCSILHPNTPIIQEKFVEIQELKSFCVKKYYVFGRKAVIAIKICVQISLIDLKRRFFSNNFSEAEGVSAV